MKTVVIRKAETLVHIQRKATNHGNSSQTVLKRVQESTVVQLASHGRLAAAEQCVGNFGTLGTVWYCWH